MGSRFTILPSIVRWRRDLAKTLRWQFYPIGRGLCGCLAYPEAALKDADDALKDARDIGQAASLMFALGNAPMTYIQCGNYADGKRASR